MKIVTKRDVIRDILNRYNEQYPRTREDNGPFPMVENRRRLEALNLETCSQADVEAAMQRMPSWVTLDCDECGKDSDALVHIGEEPDYDARWQRLCAKCLDDARGFLSGSGHVS